MESNKLKIFENINIRSLMGKKSLQRLLLFILLSAAIGYIISPKIIFLSASYEEGDILRQTIVVEEDLIIPDKVSTRLKKEKLIQEQRPIYDFDPNILIKITHQIKSSFEYARTQFSQLISQSEELRRKSRKVGVENFAVMSQQHEIRKKIQFYEKYRNILIVLLKKIQKKGKLSTVDFIEKKKFDTDLKTINQLLLDYQEKLKYSLSEQEQFEKRFDKVAGEEKNMVKGISERKSAVTRSFLKTLGIDINENEQELFQSAYYQSDIEKRILNLLLDILKKKIVISKNVLPPENKPQLEIRNLVDGKASNLDSLKDFYDLHVIRNVITETAKEYFPDDKTGKKKNLVIMLAQKMIKPTVTENKLEFEKRKDELIAGMSPVFFSLKKGEVIARAGNRVTSLQVDLISGYQETVSNLDNLPRMAGVMLVVLSSLVLVLFSFQIREDKVRLTYGNLILIMVSILITLLVVKGGMVIGEIVETRYAEIPSNIYNYMLPIALSSMLVGILLNFETALVAGLLTGLYASIMMQGNLNYFFFAIMGSIVASLPMTRFESRYSLLIHGLKISIMNIPVVVIIYLIEQNNIGIINWYNPASAVLGGILTAILVSILLPFFESIFNVTTNLKLLELSNMNHPALKQLILKAPGTYQHSIIVGNLAEAGASKIGANPLLARVSAYYHDIGKAEDAQYFIENQPANMTNIHDFLSPKKSAEIIIGHISKGVKISEKYRLGKEIRDILREHHGNRLVEYFYNKELKLSADTEDKEDLDESRFRYKGPRPQSLEAALVMLADVAEAASRSLDEPTPDFIRSMVKKVCWKVLEDGQLNESGLTLQTFHEVIDVFSGILISIHHHRIKYPEIIEKINVG